ncbi:unnamed protein product, partial [Pocillopora meandrina]
MASWLRPEKKEDQKPPQLKSRIPVRMTRLCSDNARSSSSRDKADKTARLHKDLESKVQSKQSSRIPIAVNRRKTKVDSKDNVPMNFKTTRRGKPFGGDSGIKLRETHSKQDKKTASTIPSTTTKQSSYRRAQKTTPIVRRRVPRQLTPTETGSKQIYIINEELETYRKRIETLQADLNESKVEVKRLQSKEEYKERELENLKSEFQRKEQKWEDANELLEKVMVEREELWDHVDYLEESLKDSQESNETLTFEVDELTIMIQEMKREYRVEHSRWGCGHLREEVELLNGSLELNEQRTVLLESQLDAFEAERKQLWGHVDFLEGSLRNSQESNEDLTFEVDELKIMMQELKRENTELSRHGCRHLREEVELLNGSLELREQRVTLLESQLHKLECETSKTISDLKDDIAKLQQEKSALSSELSKESEKDHHLYELRYETIKNLIEEITQERCDKDRLEQQSRRIRELETQLQKMEDMKRNRNHSVDALVLELKQESSEKERLK